MSKIIIYKDKITATEQQGNEWIEKNISKSDDHLTVYFNRLVEIKPDVTVEDFMRHLEKHEILIDYCFSGFTNKVPLRLFLNEMEKESGDTDIGDVELIWEGEILDEELVIMGFLRGWLKKEKVEELGQQYDIPHDISFVPINLIKNCKFVLNEDMIINNLGDINEMKKEVLFYGFYKWTLFEVISNFLGDLMVNGSPENRDKLYSQMENKKYDIQEVSKDRSQADFWLSFLEAELEDLKHSMTYALENEEYENASKLKAQIDAVRIELRDLQVEIDKHDESGETKAD
jgi:hypothetical protein